MQSDLVFPEAVALAPPVQKPALKAPWHLYLIGTVAVLWNTLCVFDYLANVTQFPPYMDRLPEGTREYLSSVPAWIYGVWAAAVFSGLVGAVMLLRRQMLAVRVFAVSATTTLLLTALTYSRPAAEQDDSRVFAVFIIVVSLLALNYTFHQAKRGILR